MYLLKYSLAWLPIVILGLVNATIRQLVYASLVSELAAHQISTLTFGILVGFYAWALSHFLEPLGPAQAIGVGLMWLVLTVVFEFALGRLVTGDSWSTLLNDYNILEGRVWGLFILWVGLAPYVFFRIRA